jgi:hypothetical protein
MDLAEAMNTQARGVYETKKRLLESGDDVTAKQVGEGKDLFSVRATQPYFPTNDPDMVVFIVKASAAVSEDDRLSEEEVVVQMMYAWHGAFLLEFY